MKAELVMIGSELLLGDIVDTNASYLASELASLGIDLHYKTTVGDNWLRIQHALSQALVRADIVLTSGGIGPTTDDLTREAAASAFQRRLVRSDSVLEQLQRFFAERGRTMTENNRKQAYFPEDAQILPNPTGTAPGFVVEGFGKTLIALPGVPRELKTMFHATVAPFLVAKRVEGSVILSRTLHFVGIGESAMEELVKDIIHGQNNPTVAPYASLGQVRLRVTAKAADEASCRRLIEPVEQDIRRRLAPYFFGCDGITLEERVGQLLRAQQATIAVAESCTGGLISHRLTNVPGSSAYFMAGYITYSNAAKTAVLAVPEALIHREGAVSAAVAAAMAEGARRAAAVTWGLAVTGVAGPAGGSPQKPIGTVHMAAAGPRETFCEQHRFWGEREEIKARAAQAAFDLVRRRLDTVSYQ